MINNGISSGGDLVDRRKIGEEMGMGSGYKMSR